MKVVKTFVNALASGAFFTIATMSGAEAFEDSKQGTETKANAVVQKHQSCARFQGKSPKIAGACLALVYGSHFVARLAESYGFYQLSQEIIGVFDSEDPKKIDKNKTDR